MRLFTRHTLYAIAHTLFLTALCVSGIAFMSPVPANAGIEVGAQFTDWACGQGHGTQRYVDDTDGWSSNITDDDHWDIDCVRMYVDNYLEAGEDVRIGIRLLDYSCGPYGCDVNTGSSEYTPWASEGGGWSDWAMDNDGFNFDGMRLRVDTQAADPTFWVTDIRLGMQLSDVYGLGNSGCNTGAQGTIRYTPWNDGWSSWATDSDGGDPNCLRVEIDFELAPVNPPTPTLLTQVNGGGFVDSATVEVAEGDQVDLQWSANNSPASCTGSADDGDTSFSTGGAVSGTSTDVTIPTVGNSRTFTVSCSNIIGTSTDAVTIDTAATDPEITTFEARINSGAWSSSDLVDEDAINYGDTVELQWVADADSCSGGNFSTGGSTSGGPLAVSGPFAGEVRDYTLTCTRSGGSPASEVISIEAIGDAPELTAMPKLVYEDDTVTLEWNLNGNDPSSCTLSGPALSTTASGQTGTEEITAVQGQMTYTMDCGAGGNDTATVNVQPNIFET